VHGRRATGTGPWPSRDDESLTSGSQRVQAVVALPTRLAPKLPAHAGKVPPKNRAEMAIFGQDPFGNWALPDG
jgi:hypothetical protein